jgi:mono/diheme cytochrome c family protein
VSPKKLALTASQMKREEMIAIIEKGKDKMPAFEKELTREQIIAIVDYILSLPKK